MLKYSAKIVGFKWSPTHRSRYYPIYEYVDRYGETRRYTRRKAIEKTPFTMSQKHIICKTDKQTYEKGERKISKTFCFTIAHCLSFLSLIILPKLYIYFMLSCTAAHIVDFLWPLFKRAYIHANPAQFKIVVGDVVGVQRVRRQKHMFAKPKVCYRPIISYQYEGNIYNRLSKMAYSDEEIDKLKLCNVYICDKWQSVYDEWELAKHLVDVEALFATVKQWVRERLPVAPAKTYVPQIKTQRPQVDMQSTMPLTCPFKEIKQSKKVSGWY